MAVNYRHTRLAKRYIKPSPGIATVMFRDATVDDIITTIQHADRLSAPFTQRFAPMLKGRNDHDTLRNVWLFIRRNVEYVIDNAGHEIVKSPGKTFADGYGDCKSMTVMAGSLLRNLGYDFYYRVAFYEPEEPDRGHIYAIVVLPDGEEVIVDAVNNRWNHEYRYWKKEDHQPSGSLSSVSGIPQANMHKWVGPALAIGLATFLRVRI